MIRLTANSSSLKVHYEPNYIIDYTLFDESKHVTEDCIFSLSLGTVAIETEICICNKDGGIVFGHKGRHIISSSYALNVCRANSAYT